MTDDSVFDNAIVRPPSRLAPQPDGPVVLAMAEVVGRVKEVLAQTEIVEVAPGHEVVFTSDHGWDLRGAPDDMVFTRVERCGSVTWEVECTEETFWLLCTQFLGEDAVAEMKQDLEAMLAWEGEGGSCLS